MYKMNRINIFWWVYAIVIVFFVYCNHKNLAISEYGVPMTAVILTGMIRWFIYKKNMNIYNIVFFIFVGNVFLQAILYMNVVNEGYMLTYLIYGLLGFFTSSINAKKAEVSLMSDSYIICSSIISMNTIISPADYLGRVSTRFAGGPIFEINYLAFFIFCSILLLFYKLLKRDYFTKVKRNIYIVLLLLNIYAAIRTSSRNIILGMVIFVIFLVIDGVQKKVISKKKLLNGIVIFIFGFIIFFYLFDNVIPREITERLLSFELTDQSNSVRISNWTYGINTVLKKPISGYHIITSVNAINKIMGVSTSAHNTFMGIWINLGILGIGTITCAFVQIIKKCIIMKDYCLLGICISFVAMSFIVEFDIILSFWFMLLWMIKKVQQFDYENREV